MAVRTAYGETSLVTRRYAPKTRSGCLTCKIRRVKCDESKPQCKRCASTGRRCDGYSSTSPSTDGADGLDRQSLQQGLTKSIDTYASSPALERRTLSFFRERTIKGVMGYFSDPVWDRFVLQACHTEPAVRHAVVALGSLHEEKQLRTLQAQPGYDRQLVMTTFPAAEYARALHCLQDLLKTGNANLDVVLICALLFVHFEALRENFIPTLMHAENAIKLLSQSSAPDKRKVNPGIIRTLMRSDIQGSRFLGMRVPTMSFYTNATAGVLPSKIHDLSHARDLVNTWTGRLLYFMRSEADKRKFRNPGDIPLEIIATSHDLTRTALDLDRLLRAYLHTPALRLTSLEHQGLNMLRGRVLTNRILAATCLYSEATMFDLFLDEFEQILTLCKHNMDSDTADRRLFTVSLDDGLLHPLFFIATHCRESRIRHDALAQMRKLPHTNGTWHVVIMTRVAAICTSVEEGACGKASPSCSDIAEWQRVHSAGFDGWYLARGAKTLTAHLRMRPNGMDGEWMDFEEHIECGDTSFPEDLEVLYDLRSWTLKPRQPEDRTITWP